MLMNNDMTLESMRMLLLQIPEMLALFAGILVALWNIRKHPRPSVCLLIACTILLLTVIAVEFLYFVGPEQLLGDFGGGFFLGDEFIMLARSVLAMGAYILFFVAAYISRRATPPPL